MPDFVFLKMPDEVPPCAGGKQGNFYTGLLHAAFTEQNMPRINDFLNCFRRMRLGDSNQFHLRNGTSRSGSGSFNCHFN